MIMLRILRSDIYLVEETGYGEERMLLPEKHDVLQYCPHGDGGTWYDVPIVNGGDDIIKLNRYT